jgi:hypothetical protein
MSAIPWLIALSLLALACSAFAVAVAHLKSPSERAVKVMRGCEAQAKLHLDAALDLEKKWASECALFSATRESWAVEFSGIAERCEETLDRAESKRRRIAATESRRPNGGGEPEMTREQIIEAARRRTLGAA